MTDYCDMNCDECRSTVCQTGKILEAECYEPVKSAENWGELPNHVVDEVVEDHEIAAAVALAKKVYMADEAPDQPQAGIDYCMGQMNDPEYIGLLRIYTAMDGDRIAGMAATRSSGTHLAWLYIDGAYQKQGVGTALFERVLRDDPMNQMTVQAAPSATGFYLKKGFLKKDGLIEVDGQYITPMVYKRIKK